MLTSKQRANLKRIISTEQPVVQIGKDGLSENCLDGISKVLDARELVKINVLQNCESGARNLADDIAEKLNCDVVAVIGKKIILYKYNPKNKKHIEKD